ncbi:Hypothetical protein PHPALM_1966 [Phytophthora palmivora]|uniref:Permuted papain-like amidase YaeF/Yiix C92 family enzyme n=1 Tax=Phytophthora palmivora TaxID=4796 RepID=A0A2P4YQZ3_9STRA|nr:Hypothetical protein PHPALM_1966 [Phytophthora palmivora]
MAELYPVLEIDVALPKSLIPSDHGTVGNLILYARGAGHLGQPLHHLPLILLKQVLLEYQRRTKEQLLRQQVNSIESEITLVVSTTIPNPPIDLYILNSLLSQRVRVVFDVTKPEETIDNSPSLTLLLCSRCGVSGECTCGWRQQHVILPEMEQQSVLQFIFSSLPRVPTQAVACYHLRLSIISKRNATNFGIQVYRHEMQRPIVECPFTRRLQLENYLKGVCMIDVLQHSVPLLVFLGVLSTSYVEHVAMRRYRRQILHLQVLELYTRPGDLILFNGRAKASTLQRSMTRAEWDHVAIVVPAHEGGNLQLLEATGDGVTLTPLTARLLAYSTFHVRYFVLRKLRTPLLSRAVVNDLLERFTAKVEGLSYSLSIRRILYTGQVNPTRSQANTFFCSELVAAAYKSLGIISHVNAAKDFWPGSFSPGDFVDSELSRHGASLSPEIIIDCKILEVAAATTHKSPIS